MKKKNSLVIGLSIAVSCACITLLVLFIVFGNPLIPKTERFQGQIGSCDAALLAGNLRSAKRSLIRASRAAEGNMSWLRVLKRARILSQTEGDYAVLLNLSAKAQSSLPGREEFHALSLYAALKSGESALAAEEASKLRSERFKRLREEALISVLSLEEQTEPETLIRIAEATQDNRLALDAALKQASRGKFPEAQKALAIAGPERFPLVSALIAYDNRDFEAARTYLNAVQEGLSPAALLLVSDMYIQTNALLSANVVLADFLNTYPGYSPVAYTNLAFLTESAGFDGDSYLRQGLYRFPDSFELISKLLNRWRERRDRKRPAVRPRLYRVLSCCRPENAATPSFSSSRSGVPRRDGIWRLRSGNSTIAPDGSALWAVIFPGTSSGRGDTIVSANSSCRLKRPRENPPGSSSFAVSFPMNEEIPRRPSSIYKKRGYRGEV
jgi:hypothetical protein